MQLTYIPQYTILWQNFAHACPFQLQNGAFWDFCHALWDWWDGSIRFYCALTVQYSRKLKQNRTVYMKLYSCQNMKETCSYVSFVQNNIYTPVPGVNSTRESFPPITDSLLCCVWYDVAMPIRFRLIGHGYKCKWLRRSIQKWAAWLPPDCRARLQYWHPAHEAIRS